jgi:hypothetical protein
VLGAERARQIMASLTRHGITCAAFGAADAAIDGYDAVLELSGDGAWQGRPA